MKVKHAKRLDEQEHRALALWATACAAHVLAYFESQDPQDDRPRKAIEVGRAWVRGEIPMGKARAAAFGAHAARAADHAAVTAHVAGHARHAATYVVTAAWYAAVRADAVAVTATERDW